MPISTAVDQSAVARVVGIKTEYKDFRGGNIVYLPQRVAVIGTGAANAVYDTTKKTVTSASQVGELYGFGSPLHLAVQQLLPVNGDGLGTIPVTVYPLEFSPIPLPAQASIEWTTEPTEDTIFRVSVNGTLSDYFNYVVGESDVDLAAKTAEAINSVLDMSVTATATLADVHLAAKFSGGALPNLVVEVIGELSSLALVKDFVAGAGANEIQPALDQIGNVWETIILNCDSAEEANLDLLQTFGEGRWGPLIKKPLVAISGNTEKDPEIATAVSDLRADDRINVMLNFPGSPEIPFVAAARAVARIAKRANNNPAHDYGSLDLSGLAPGLDSDQWTYIQRDYAVKRGGSTSESKDGVINISDTITMYHPTGNPLPEYRYVVDIVKLQNVIFNIDLIFNSANWDGAPLIPDDDPTANRTAKKPKMAVAAMASMCDSLGLEAILSDIGTTKKGIRAQINEQNPKRLDVCIPVKLSGNVNIVSVDLKFGFYFGIQEVIG